MKNHHKMSRRNFLRTKHYTGWESPDLGNLKARYITTAAYSNWAGDNNCMGLSEVRFNINDQTTSTI